MRSSTMAIGFVVCLLLCTWGSEGKLTASYAVGNTSCTVTMKTATYRHANTSFSVAGHLHFVDGSDPSGLAAEIAGTIIVVDYDVYSNSFAWARACQSNACAGVVMVSTKMPTIASSEAWLERDRGGIHPGEHLSATPLVILDGIDALPSMDDVRNRPGPITAVLDSCDIQEGTSASALFAEPGAVAAFAVAWFVNVVNIVAAIYKFAAFGISEEGHLRVIPLFPCTVFTTSLVSSTIRMLWFANAAFYNLQLFSRPFYRILMTSFVPVQFAGTAAIGMAMHEHLMQGKAVSTPHRLGMYSLLGVLGVIFTIDEIGTFVAALTWHEYFNVTYLSTIYFLMNIPASILFIKYGTAVSNALLTNDKISIVERARSLQFARRVATSGAMGIAVLLTQILFTALNAVNVGYYFMLYTLTVTMGAVQCFTFISAFRPRSSIFDMLARSYMPSSLVPFASRSASPERNKDASARIAPATIDT